MSHPFSAIFLLGSISLLVRIPPIWTFFGDQWSVLSVQGSPAGTESKHGEPKCLEIPRNFSLCHGMQYSSMRLPNLLDHDTLDEAIQQGSAWVSLLRLHCHPNTKLFLCSLFAPMCLPQLDRPIQPCQSLCRAVEEGCAERMEKYGFPWPAMLNCSQFPADHDLCVKPPSTEQSDRPPEAEEEIRSPCKACSQVATFENLMDNFCRSSTVLKVRLRPPSSSSSSSFVSIMRVLRVFKNIGKDHGDLARIPIGLAEPGERKCHCALWVDNPSSNHNFLLMASEHPNSDDIAVQLIVPWRQEKSFKRTIRRFKKVNCSTLGREIRESVMSQIFISPKKYSEE